MKNYSNSPNTLSTSQIKTPRNKNHFLTTHQSTNSYSKSLSNVFLSKSPSQSSIQVLSLSPESLYTNFKFKFSNLKKTIQSFHRTKSELVLHSYKKYDRYHHGILKNKLKKNYSNFFLTSNNLGEEKKTFTDNTSTTIVNDTAVSPKSINQILTNSFYIDKKIRLPKMLGDNIKHYPILTHQDFSKKCLNQLKCGILFNVKKKSYIDQLEDNINRYEKVENEYYSLLHDRDLINCFSSTYLNYLKFLEGTVTKELKYLNTLTETKLNLEIKNKNLSDKIERLKKLKNKYSSLKILVTKCCGTDEIDANVFFDKMNSLQQKILRKIGDYQKIQEEIIRIKQKYSLLHEIYLENCKKEEQLIKEGKEKLNNLKKKNEILLKNKINLIYQRNQSSLIRNTLKAASMKNLSLINSSKCNEIFVEMKFEKLIAENPKLFTCISTLVSGMIKNLLVNTPEFVELQTSNTHVIISMEELLKIINKKYTDKNINEVRSNIIVMLKIIERSFEKILFNIDLMKKNKNNQILADKMKSKIEATKKIKGIQDQKQAMEKIRSQILDNVVHKQKKIVLISHRKVDDKTIINHKLKEKIPKNKENFILRASYDEKKEFLFFE